MDNVLSHLNGRSLKLIDRYNIITIEKSKKERFLHATFNSHIYLYIIFHLAVVSLERLHATLGHFVIDSLVWKSTYLAAIAPPWILSLSSTSMLSKFRPVSSWLFFTTICLITSDHCSLYAFHTSQFGERWEKVPWKAVEKTKKQDFLGAFFK